MYEEKIIENLRKYAHIYAYDNQELSETCLRAYNSIEMLLYKYKMSLNEIEELQKPKWIPVTERLPEIGETVLVCYRWINPSNKLSVTCDFLHIHSTTMKPVWWKHNHSHRVLYWMSLPPMPEPPKEDTDG